MRFLKEVTALPTAPFGEDQVIAYAKQFAKDHPKLKLRRDRVGNLLLELPGKSRGPRWLFSAHMDHPGLTAGRAIDARTIEAAFHGGVLLSFFKNARVRFFTPGGEVRGTVIAAKSDDTTRDAYPQKLTVRVAASIPPGSIGMFDLSPGKVKGKIFHGRALDDLAGAAAALDMLDQLYRKPPKVTVAVMLTRGEEEGFLGCIGAVLHPTLLKKSDRIIGIECSAKQPYAKQGDGVILRVGDRTSIFNSALTYFIDGQGRELAKIDKTFKHQRALMPGGTCESTVYDAYGYTAAAVCVPLGNYHNMDREKNRLAEEYIHLGDWQNMVKLFVAIARNAPTFDPNLGPLKARIEARFKKFAKALAV